MREYYGKSAVKIFNLFSLIQLPAYLQNRLVRCRIDYNAETTQIIQQAEKQKRGYYTGIFGIFDGETLQSAVAIRFISEVDEKFYFHSGGGITIHSNVQDEYKELLEKVYLPIKGAD